MTEPETPLYLPRPGDIPRAGLPVLLDRAMHDDDARTRTERRVSVALLCASFAVVAVQLVLLLSTGRVAAFLAALASLVDHPRGRTRANQSPPHA